MFPGAIFSISPESSRPRVSQTLFFNFGHRTGCTQQLFRCRHSTLIVIIPAQVHISESKQNAKQKNA